MNNEFILKSKLIPKGDQPQAIKKLVEGALNGELYQTLEGVTGSGKTYTMANVIKKLNKPTLIMAPNKTLAAQLYGEMKDFFPNNAVEYFVSYYDYYQPEAYVASTDTFIEKDASINEHIEQMRLSATKSLLERRDVVIVASVSAIYGLGDPDSYLKMVLHLRVGDFISKKDLTLKLAELQLERNDTELKRGCYRVRGDVVDIFPAESEKYCFRIESFDDEIENISSFDPLTGALIKKNISRVTIYPKTHYVTPRSTILDAIRSIKSELHTSLQEFHRNEKFIEEQRLRERTLFDIEMMKELGYCSGIENYSRYLSGRIDGNPPPTLMDYFPSDGLMFIDESHVTVPQIGAMYKGDRSRKENLVKYGFRLPSALDNRPLKFKEFEDLSPQTIFVSATPSHYELDKSGKSIRQIIRPTGLLDPVIHVKPASTQVDDLVSAIKRCTEKNERVLITTLTKKMAEDLTNYYAEQGIKIKYLHSDIDTVERVEIIQDLRAGNFDVLVGINLLREGLDMPEVSLVAILDADKEGFLRSERSLIQTIGRAARNVNGQAILYADNITKSMDSAIKITRKRRELQNEFNVKHNVKPKQVQRKISDIMEVADDCVDKIKIPEDEYQYTIKDIPNLEKKMKEYALSLEFEQAAKIRDKINILKKK